MLNKNSKKILTIHLVGGIGNQLFCYYAGIYLANRNSRTLDLDFTDVNLGHNTEDISAFPNCLPRKVSRIRKIFKKFRIMRMLNSINYRYSVPPIFKGSLLFPLKEIEVNLIEKLRNRTNIHIEGYFQKSDYFQAIKKECPESNILRNSNPTFLTPINCDPESTLAVHVRRGDYSGHKNSFGLLSLEWYQDAINNALNYLGDRIETIILFTNDSDWVSQNQKSMVDRPNLNVIIERDSQFSRVSEIFILMTKCKGLVISNSTFSLMAAYHNRNQIFAPSIFFKNHPSELLNKDFPKMHRIISKWEI